MRQAFAALAILAISTQALAAGAVCSEATHRVELLSPFTLLVQNYLSADFEQQMLKRNQYAKNIRKEVFKNSGNPQYIEMLQYIDSQAEQAPIPIYELVRSLQTQWQAMNPRSLAPQRAENAAVSTKVGAVVGMTALAVLMWRKPEVTPLYLKLARQVLPLTGIAAGGLAGNAIISPALAHGSSVSPAHVIRLGITTDDLQYDENQIFRQLAPLIANVTAGSLVYGLASGTAVETQVFLMLRNAVRAAEVANTAATPAKINPYVLVGSIVAGLVAEKGVGAAIDWNDLKQFKKRVIEARNLMERSMEAADDVSLFNAAEGLAKTAINLSTYLNRAINQASLEYMLAVDEAIKEYGEDTPGYRVAIEKQSYILGTQLRLAAGERDHAEDKDYQAISTILYLLNQGEGSIENLNGDARARVEFYRQAFESWLRLNEQKNQATLGVTSREELFNHYFEGLLKAKDKKLALEFLSGEISERPNHLLLQAAALIRYTGKDYIEDQADLLMAQIDSDELLLRQKILPDYPPAYPEDGQLHMNPL